MHDMHDMRIAFYVNGNRDRNGPIDGVSIRHGGSATSGTDTSAVVMAEQLAMLGHEVVVASERPPPAPSRTVRGVRYTDLAFSDMGEERTFDVFVNTLWFQRYEEDLADTIEVTRAVVQWCHMQYVYGVGEMAAYCAKRGLALGVVAPSEWALRHLLPTVERLRVMTGLPVPASVVPNPLPEDLFSVGIPDGSGSARWPRSVAFHTTWGRGGEAALGAVRLLNADADAEGAWRMHACSYLKHGVDPRDPVDWHGELDKASLYRMLSRCEYFAYPCVDAATSDVHMDTFGCVVAEALAMGCTVVAYRLGALPDLFGPCVEFVDFPDGADVDAMGRVPLAKDPVMVERSSAAFADRLRALDADDEPTKRARRARNAAFVRDNFPARGAAERFATFLNFFSG